MDLFTYADELHYGDLHLRSVPEVGLHAIVAVHNLKLGPAIGGTRFIEYDSTEAAIRDAMRLARGMTYKAAISGLAHGGGKAVIIRPRNMSEAQREEIFAAFGQFVDTIGGRYITCEDSGTKVSDMNVVARHTKHVLGTEDKASSGDPSPYTAFGVRRGIEAAVEHKLGKKSLEGLHVTVQGVGHVGYYLAKELHDAGCRLTVTDVNAQAVERCVTEFGAAHVAPQDIYGVEADIFAPCALGAIIHDGTLPQLKVQIIAGAANNQLAENRHGDLLKARGILYAPDYAINAGGLINVAQEYQGYNADKARAKAATIYETMHTIFERAATEDLATYIVADRIVEEKVFGRILNPTVVRQPAAV